MTFSTTFALAQTGYRLTVDNSILDKTLEYLLSKGCKAQPLLGSRNTTTIAISSMPQDLLDYHIKRFNPKPFAHKPVDYSNHTPNSKYQAALDKQTERDFSRMVGA
jgi:hypothetical protein